MWMSYGEFCEALGLAPGTESFQFWLISHRLTPCTAKAVIEKRRAELAAIQGT